MKWHLAGDASRSFDRTARGLAAADTFYSLDTRLARGPSTALPELGRQISNANRGERPQAERSC